jgi:hypothetical protein
MVFMALKIGSHVVVICSMKKENRNNLNTIVRQCVIHVIVVTTCSMYDLKI